MKNGQLDEFLSIISVAQEAARQRIDRLSGAAFTKETYCCYLTMQYHLTKGVQRYFLEIASHPAFAGRHAFREFLFRFAIEEEPHFGVAEGDLRELDARPGPLPLDVTLWHVYFQRIISERPFIRMGAATVLENVGPGGGETLKALLASADFITPATSRFIRIHMHEELPHGDQLLDALSSLDLSEQEIADLCLGARQGAVMFFRMIDDAFGLEPLLETFQPHGTELNGWQ